MPDQAVPKKYAQALLRLTGSEIDTCTEIIKSFRGIEELFDLKDSRQVMCSPVMPKGLKRTLLQYALKKSESSETIEHFVNLVLDAGRVKDLPEIIKTYENLVYQENNVKKAVVFTAHPIDTPDFERVKADLESIFSCKVRLESKVDEDLLGGLAVHVGNSIIDLSLKTKLETITSTKLVRGT